MVLDLLNHGSDVNAKDLVLIKLLLLYKILMFLVRKIFFTIGGLIRKFRYYISNYLFILTFIY